MPGDAGARGDVERARKECRDIGHDVDRWIGGLAVVHDDHRHGVLGHHPRQAAVALQTPHVVDDRGAGRERPGRHLGLHGVDRDRNAESDDRWKDRRKPAHFLLERDRHRAAVGTSRLRADIQDVGALRDHPAGLVDGDRGIEKAAAVRKGVGRDVEHAHHDRPSERQQTREGIRRCLLVAGQSGSWARKRHDRGFAPVPAGVSSTRTIRCLMSSIRDLAGKLPGVLDPAGHELFGGKKTNQLSLLVGLGHGFGEPGGVAIF